MSQITANTDVVSLARAFIDTESTSGNEESMAIALENWLQPKGFIVERQKVSSGRYNLLAYPKGTNPFGSDLKILFNSHIDTVPPYFKSSIKVNKNGQQILCGRGSCDTKSLIASQLFAVINLIKNHHINNIALLYVVGEEVDHIGMEEANKLNLYPKYLIVGEPTESKTVKRQKGMLKFKLISAGMAAHSGYPETGQCSLSPLIKILHHIQNIEEWPSSKEIGNTTVNIGLLKSGIASNIIPEYSEAVIMFRCVTDPILIQKRMKEIINFYDILNQIEYKLISKASPQIYESVSEEFNPSVVSFGTDIPYFNAFKENKLSAVVLYGPGSIKDAHTKREHVIIDDLKKSVDNYTKIALKLLNGDYDGNRSKL